MTTETPIIENVPGQCRNQDGQQPLSALDESKHTQSSVCSNCNKIEEHVKDWAEFVERSNKGCKFIDIGSWGCFQEAKDCLDCNKLVKYFDFDWPAEHAGESHPEDILRIAFVNGILALRIVSVSGNP
jgi:hypothetical protein